jgi:hypothetical protein
MKPAHIGLVAFLVLAAPAAGAPSGLKQKVLDLVRLQYIHGIPPAMARELGPRAVPDLEEILNDPSGKHYWKNAAAATGVIGSKRSFRVLRNFVWKRFRGPVDGETMLALVTAQSSIAGIPPEAEPRVEDYLWQGANPAYWDSLPWWPASDRHLGVVFSKLSINGLGWMGTRRSEQHLGALSKRPFHPQQRASIASALRRTREIRRMGREAYVRALDAEAERKQPVPSFR